MKPIEIRPGRRGETWPGRRRGDLAGRSACWEHGEECTRGEEGGGRAGEGSVRGVEVGVGRGEWGVRAGCRKNCGAEGSVRRMEGGQGRVRGQQCGGGQGEGRAAWQRTV